MKKKKIKIEIELNEFHLTSLHINPLNLENFNIFKMFININMGSYLHDDLSFWKAHNQGKV